MEYKSFSPYSEKLPPINLNSPKKPLSKPKIILKRLQSENPGNLAESWTSKLLNWRAILEDQKEYRQMITKIEIINQKMSVGRKRKVSPYG